MKPFFDAFRQYAPIGEAAQADLIRMVAHESVPKGTVLLQAGQVCSRLYLLEAGMARGYYLHDGKELTSWFAFEGDVMLSMHSFTTRRPAFETIEILENSSLYSIEYEHLQYLYAHHAEISTIGRLLSEKYYVELEEHTLALQVMPAKARYERLLAQQPQVLQRAQLSHIASYLGMSQETLSRIRGKR
ncbi:MAG: Crp/Fnr family transcriptional regulator [Bacteroidia bacterium]|nr:Crp/Fnr family transcriptional regulator [Bacteroidia bacterium]